MLEALIAWAVLPTLGWRWLVGASAVPTLALLALFPWVPESPLWLASKGRHAEAEAVLRRVAAINRRPLHLRLAPSSPRPAAAAEPGDAAQLLPGSSGSALGLSASGHLSVRTGSARARSPPPGPRLASPDAQAPLLAVRPLDAGAAGAAIPAAHPGGAQHSMPSHHRWADALRTVRTAGAVIFGPQLLRTTLILFLIFNCNAITYYGAA